ncbi:MAG: hypothetical protein PUC50_09210 [Bacteroidales bacterium]|nr:hypothetical protein [Bacteroidales bacterium]
MESLLCPFHIPRSSLTRIVERAANPHAVSIIWRTAMAVYLYYKPTVSIAAVFLTILESCEVSGCQKHSVINAF